MGMDQRPGLPPDGSDQVRFGPSREPGVRVAAWLRRPLAGRLALGVAALATLAVAAFMAATAGHLGHHRPGVTGPAATGRPRAQPWWLAARPVVTTSAGHQLPGERSGWELFGAGPGVLIRIQRAAGRVTRTTVPALQSSGPVCFVAGPHQAIIRPLDFVPGYLVPDDHLARTLPATLGTAGQAFPGPRPGQVWVQSGFGDETVMSLVTASGARIGPSIRLPADVGYGAVPDGRGYSRSNATAQHTTSARAASAAWRPARSLPLARRPGWSFSARPPATASTSSSTRPPAPGAFSRARPPSPAGRRESPRPTGSTRPYSATDRTSQQSCT